MLYKSVCFTFRKSVVMVTPNSEKQLAVLKCSSAVSQVWKHLKNWAEISYCETFQSSKHRLQVKSPCSQLNVFYIFRPLKATLLQWRFQAATTTKLYHTLLKETVLRRKLHFCRQSRCQDEVNKLHIVFRFVQQCFKRKHYKTVAVYFHIFSAVWAEGVNVLCRFSEYEQRR
jgi:hypothetical protein